MSEERLEEDWDTDFLEQLIQVEEQALSSQHPKPPKPPPQPPHLLPSSSHSNPIRAVTYSPPRELTQRSSSNGISHSAPPPPPPYSSSSCPELEKELEIARLKVRASLHNCIYLYVYMKSKYRFLFNFLKNRWFINM